MNPQPATATFTPEHAEAALALAVEQYAPKAAQDLILLLTMARDSAPEGEADAWMTKVRTSFVDDVSAVWDRMVAHIGATPAQAERFTHAFSDALQARFVELRIGAERDGGQA